MNNVSTVISYDGLEGDVVNQHISVFRLRSGYRVYHKLTKYHWDVEEMDAPAEEIFIGAYETPSERGILEVFESACDTWDLNTKDGWDHLFEKKEFMEDERYLSKWREMVLNG